MILGFDVDNTFDSLPNFFDVIGVLVEVFGLLLLLFKSTLTVKKSYKELIIRDSLITETGI